MLKRILYLIIGEPHTGKAVKSMEKATRKLQVAAAYQANKADRAAAAARAAELASAKAMQESERANRVFKKLADLLEV